MIFRRSNRSDMIPPSSTKRRIGTDHAMPTTDSAVGELDSW